MRESTRRYLRRSGANAALPASQAQTSHYENVMESLVEAQVAWQLARLPITLAQSLDQSEIATYALNRLPPLYASCQKGKYRQTQFAKEELRLKIPEAVRQGIAAVQRDPLRNTSPLVPERTQKYRAALNAMEDLRRLLQERHLLDENPSLSWPNLVDVVKRAIDKTTWAILSRYGVENAPAVRPQTNRPLNGYFPNLTSNQSLNHHYPASQESHSRINNHSANSSLTREDTEFTTQDETQFFGVAKLRDEFKTCKS